MTLDSTLDIPDFLKVANRVPLSPERAAEVAAWLKAAQPPKARKHTFEHPVNIEPAGRALLQAIEKDKRDQQKARLKELAERRKAAR